VETSETRLATACEKAIKKFNSTYQKSTDVAKRLDSDAETLRQMNDERFSTRDMGLKRAKDERNDFLNREQMRQKNHLAARERILHNMSMEHA